MEGGGEDGGGGKENGGGERRGGRVLNFDSVNIQFW